MLTFRIIVCIATAIISTEAEIPYDAVEANIFDHIPRDFELHVLNSTQITKDFFARDDVLLAIAAGHIALEYLPCVGEFAKLIPLMRDTLEDRSEWRGAFTKAIADETMRTIAESESRWMEAALQTIQEKFILLGENNPDLSNRKTIASIIHTDLDTMINFFELKTCLFRKHPIIGAPPLILLASLVAIFSPIAKALIPLEAKYPQISCKMHDILQDYREISVNARLQRLRAEKSIFPSLVNVMSLPYNPFGYNKTDPGVIDCEKGCKANRTFPIELCLKDQFSDDEYDVNNGNGTPTCVEDYAALLRHRVEKLFPIELMNNLCVDRFERELTGMGWLTINIHHVYAHCQSDGSLCKIGRKRKCDSYIKLFVDDQEVLKTPKKKNRDSYNPYVTFTTDRIAKNSTVRIEVWDASYAFWEKEALIQTTAGSVESFVKEPLRAGAHCYENKQNSLETMSFWRDDLLVVGATKFMRKRRFSYVSASRMAIRD